MNEIYGRSSELPLLVVHCGAGSYSGAEEVLNGSRQAVVDALNAAWPKLLAGASALDAVCAAVESLENSPWSNAGCGSDLQADGLARLTAGLMDGARRKFSGVMSVTHLNNPSKLARALQNKDESVLGPLGAQLLARELGLPPENPAMERTALTWARSFAAKGGSVQDVRGDTVGAVALDSNGRIASATSTGGRRSGPDRISDAATVAGTYASEFAGISCTGIGEQLVDDGFAVRLECRVRDGKSLEEASRLCLKDARERSRHYGWIALSRDGSWALCHTTPHMPCGVITKAAEKPVLL